MPQLKKTKDPTARTSMMIAVVMHAIAFLVFFVWAAQTGKLDPLLKIMNVVPVAKEKQAPKPKPEEIVKPSELPKINSTTPEPSAPAPAASQTANVAPPPAAPPPAAAADFVFSDGAKEVQTSTNAPIDYYKNVIEYTIRANWQRPEGMADEQFVAEVELQLDPTGKITHYQLTKGSGDKAWDKTVVQALAATKSINRPPPKGFPDKFVVRFDVVADAFAVSP